MADDGDGGHDEDAQEDPDDYIDRLFSRKGVWSVVVGFGITNILLHGLAVAWPGIPVGTHDDWFVIWSLTTPLLVIGGMKWPDFERRYAHLLPYMDRGKNG